MQEVMPSRNNKPMEHESLQSIEVVAGKGVMSRVRILSPSRFAELGFSENVSRQTSSPDLPSDGYKKPHTLAAGGCTLTTAEPPPLQSAVVITQ